MMVVDLHDADTLRGCLVQHGCDMRGVDDRVVLLRPVFEDLKYIFVAVVVEVDSGFLEQQDAVLVLAASRTREEPCERDVPAKPCRATIEPYGHPETNVLHHDVEGGRVDVDLELDVLL